MAPPVAGEVNLLLENSDNCITHSQHITPSDSADNDFTISQLIQSKRSNTNPSPLPPSTSSRGKRRKSKPVRYSSDIVETTHLKWRNNTVVQDPLSTPLSCPKGKSATKHAKSEIKTPPAMVKAEEIQSTLGTKHPSCIKMVKAHTDHGYWMGFPQWFGKVSLPKTDSEMVIEDENGEIHHVKYIAEKTGLSAGWKKFAVDHNLLDGDVLVFQLVESHKFKVYIVRANDLKPKGSKSVSLTTVQKKQKLPPPSELLEGSTPFQELKMFEDFHITVNGASVDSELPEGVRMDYFKLCRERNDILHDCLPESIYHKLVAGMIGETVSVANKIKNCKITVTKEEFDVWDNSLKSFSLLGMKVGFLRERICTLSSLVFEPEIRSDIERYKEAKKEQKRVEDEIKRVTEEVKKLKESSRKLQGVVDELKRKVGTVEVKFQEEVNAPW